MNSKSFKAENFHYDEGVLSLSLKLFIKLIQSYHTFNYKKVFPEMDAFG